MLRLNVIALEPNENLHPAVAFEADIIVRFTKEHKIQIIKSRYVIDTQK